MMFEYQLEHILSYSITVTFPEMIGPVSDGLRLNFHITGGEVTGPKVFGRVLPAGADWARIRPDGIGLIDVRATFETQDGALIYVTVDGSGDFGDDGYALALAGNPPMIVRFRTFLRFHTADPRYTWLNRLHCFGIGEGRFAEACVAYDVYAIH